MSFIEQEIKGVYLVELMSHLDERGSFRRLWDRDLYADEGLQSWCVQVNLSTNPLPYTLRGFHYQKFPHYETKTITCLRGRIYDVVVDIRKKSSTFGKWQAFELKSPEKNQDCLTGLYVPEGCANAFLTLEDNCMVHYSTSYPFIVSHYSGIRWNDPFFNFVWPHKPEVTSEQDKNWPDFKE